jgi:serine/threonine protein kinase
VPPLPLAPGTLLDGYRLGAPLGCGEEGVVYTAVERTTRLPFALKVLHEKGWQGRQLAARTARIFHKLRGTGAVATYHRCGLAGERVYLRFDRLDGVLLEVLLRRRRWSQAWTAEEACLLLHAMARKLAAVHRCGLAIGDFTGGNNVILVGGREPVFCDLDVGELGFVNRDYRFDLELLVELAIDLAGVQPPCPTLQQVAWLIATQLERRPTRSRMTRLAKAIGQLPL